MDLITLQGNYAAVLSYYMNQNGGLVGEVDQWVEWDSFPNPKAGQVNEPNNFLKITSWKHPSPKPTNEQMMRYRIEDVLQTEDDDSKAKIVSYCSFMKCDTKQRDRLPVKRLTNGDCIFNTTSKSLQIFIDSKWKNVQLLDSVNILGL